MRRVAEFVGGRARFAHRQLRNLFELASAEFRKSIPECPQFFPRPPGVFAARRVHVSDAKVRVHQVERVADALHQPAPLLAHFCDTRRLLLEPLHLAGHRSAGPPQLRDQQADQVAVDQEKDQPHPIRESGREPQAMRILQVVEAYRGAQNRRGHSRSQASEPGRKHDRQRKCDIRQGRAQYRAERHPEPEARQHSRKRSTVLNQWRAARKLSHQMRKLFCFVSCFILSYRLPAPPPHSFGYRMPVCFAAPFL